MFRPENRKNVLIGLLAVICVVAAIVDLIHFGAFSQAPQHKPQNALGNALAPESSLQQTAPALVGFDNLVALGVTMNQINALQTAFQHYKPTSAANTIIDASGGSPVQNSPDIHDPLYRFSIESRVVVNQKASYKIKFYYWGTSTIELLVYDNTGTTKLFDSGVVTGSS